MKRILMLSVLILSVCTMNAKVTLPPIFAENMVLQHQSDAALWGYEKVPFYFTQIAPYKHAAANRRDAAYMMWAQAQTIEIE